jgi:hypothetical protein
VYGSHNIRESWQITFGKQILVNSDGYRSGATVIDRIRAHNQNDFWLYLRNDSFMLYTFGLWPRIPYIFIANRRAYVSHNILSGVLSKKVLQ